MGVCVCVCERERGESYRHVVRSGGSTLRLPGLNAISLDLLQVKDNGSKVMTAYFITNVCSF